LGQRLFLGTVLILAGLFALARQSGVAVISQIQIASLGILLAGLWLFFSTIVRRALFPALLGAWIAAYGGLDLLRQAGYAVPSNHLLYSAILPVLLVGLGLQLLYRPRGGHKHSRKNRTRGTIGDQRIGQDPWRLSGDLQLHHGIGDMRVDLSTAIIEPGTHLIEVSHGIGNCTILVPTDVNVTIDAHVKMGGLEVLDQRRGGPNSHLRGGWSRPESPVSLLIEAHLGTGELRVIPAHPIRPEGWVSE
jgi:hypothetical protein